MANPYYNHGSYPLTGSFGYAANMRAELDAIAAGFNLLPTLAGNNSKLIKVDPTGSYLTPATPGTDYLTLSNFASPPALGDVSPAAVHATTLSASGASTLAAVSATTLSASGASTLAAVSATTLSASGVTTLQNGTVAAPSLNFGDLATGWYRPALNQGAWSANGVQALMVDALGFVGLKITPSAWGAALPSLDVGNGAAISNNSSIFSAIFAANEYNNGTNWLYKNTGYASRVSFNSGGAGNVDFFTAPSGTAGNVVTEMTVVRFANDGTCSFAGTPGAESLRVVPVASAAVRIEIAGNVASGFASIGVAGTTPSGVLYKAPTHTFYDLATLTEQFRIAATPSSTSFLIVTGSTFGNPTLSSSGSNANIVIAPNGTGQCKIKGASDGSDASSGDVGQYNSVNSGVMSLTSGALSTATTTLTPGDWLITGSFQLGNTVTTSFTGIDAVLNLNNAFGTLGINWISSTFPAVVPNSRSIGITFIPLRVSVSVTTTLYYGGSAVFTVSTATGVAIISARRIR